MEKPPLELTPTAINPFYSDDVTFDYLESFLLHLKPRLSKVQEILFMLIRNISMEERKKSGGRDPVCRLSIAQYQKMVSSRIPVTRDGIRHALKVLQDRELIHKEGTWGQKNVFIPIDPIQDERHKGIKVHIETQVDPGLHRAASQIFGRIEYMLRDGKRIYIDWTNKQLADDMGVSEITARIALRELQHEQYIIIRNPGTKFREIGLHPEWKEIHAPLVQKFKQSRLVGMITDKIQNPKIRRKYKKRGILRDGPNGDTMVVLYQVDQGDHGSFISPTMVVSYQAGHGKPIEIIESNSDSEAPNKIDIINKIPKDKKIKSKDFISKLRLLPEYQELSEQEMSCLSKEAGSCFKKDESSLVGETPAASTPAAVPVYPDKERIPLLKKRAAPSVPDSATVDCKLKVDSVLLSLVPDATEDSSLYYDEW